MNTTLRTALVLGIFFGTGAVACTGDAARAPEEGNAYLSIVGESSVFMENGWQQAIIVRYHDGDDHPLAGQIDFAITGAGGGATLSSGSAVTDREGEATVVVNAGASGDAAFSVEASADYADPVSWRIAVHTDQPLGPLDPSGRYRVQSQFDMVGGLPGTVGQITNTFLDMTDGPNDPATWLIDQAVDSIDSSTTRAIINAARPTLDQVVNQALRSASPQLVDDLLEVGHDFGQVARKFGTQSTLEVVGSADGFTSSHTLTHLVFTVDDHTSQFALTELGMTNPAAADVAFTSTDSQSTIGSHQFPLSYGSVLLVALDNVIIPAIEPGANDLEGFLGGVINCDFIGNAMADYIGFGGSLYAGACRLGLSQAAHYVEGRILSLDQSALIMNIDGTARPIDTNTDRKVDILQNGAWTGSVSYAGAPVTLGASTFRGDRLAD